MELAFVPVRNFEEEILLRITTTTVGSRLTGEFSVPSGASGHFRKVENERKILRVHSQGCVNLICFYITV